MPDPGLIADVREARILYEELQEFKHDPEFVLRGFAVCCRFNKWLKRVEALRDRTGMEFLTEYDFVPGDIMILGMNYVMGDYDTQGTKWLEAKIERGLSNP